MASMNEVAKRAGVSIATVSRVLNNNESVNEDTRNKILAAIKELKYSPSRVAKRLRSKNGGGNMIGIMIPDISNPFYVEVLKGIESIAFEQGYVTIFCNFEQSEEKETAYLKILESEAIDGLIAASVNDVNPILERMLNAGLPVVCVDRDLKGVNVDLVQVDNEYGTYNAVSYLIKSGYKRIGYIGGLNTISTSKAREAGYCRALVESGLEVDESLVLDGDSSLESGASMAEQLLSLTNPPDALFCGNNLLTLGALKVINRRGIKVPEDIGIVGFDDMAWASSLNPPLTSVHQPAREIGRRAGDLLIQRIKNPNRPTAKIVLETELRVRKSC
ncbi:MAG: LacI family DNA-binding transcriptional regulator [Mangrovibacterium sp.]